MMIIVCCVNVCLAIAIDIMWTAAVSSTCVLFVMDCKWLAAVTPPDSAHLHRTHLCPPT